jgi:6-phosphogluconolactonase/glucosamine-6-phosphate isomerase/deaminase
MSFTIITTTNGEEAAQFLASSILKQLELGKKVLFFIPGGSSIPVAVRAAEILRESRNKNLQNLTITLTDERYGEIDHPDSNWHQLKENGFNLPDAKLLYVLSEGDNLETTAQKWSEVLDAELKNADYKIGLFGMGADGHTAGILPESPALQSENFAHGYVTQSFSRITMTEKAIEKLDEAVAWVQGENKWEVIKNLAENIPITKQPAQILKKVPTLTIFTDYKNEKNDR